MSRAVDGKAPRICAEAFFYRRKAPERMFMRGHIYFHCPCFDGIVSAALASDFLESRQGWHEVSLRGVNYHLKNESLAISLEKPAAVVDFLYHPDADF